MILTWKRPTLNPLVAVIAVVALAVRIVVAQPEIITQESVLSEGILNSPENVVQQHGLTGGYTLGRFDVNGSLLRVEPDTWLIDARIVITAPNGETFDLHPFAEGTTFSSASFSASHFFRTVGDPAGMWTFRYYELIDDEDNGAFADAVWTSISFTFTNEMPQPPVATDLGVLMSPGASPAAGPLNAGEIKWFRFELPCPLEPRLGTYLDIETSGSNISGNNDTEIAFFNAAGTLLGTNDDAGPGLSSQLTFGAGTRPPFGSGAIRDGADGPLPPGDYYLAVAGHPLALSGEPWGAQSVSALAGTVEVDLHTNVGTLAADLTGDDTVDVFDLLAYLSLWFSLDAAAERTGDFPSQIDVFDLLAYLDVWFNTTGQPVCP